VLVPVDFSPSSAQALVLAIIEQEQESDGDLIVIGKHGQSVVEDCLPGSVTTRVLAESVGDVLVSTARAA